MEERPQVLALIMDLDSSSGFPINNIFELFFSTVLGLSLFFCKLWQLAFFSPENSMFHH